jgi:lipoprotein-anchoring transpeptidase ErfK/SrfK
MHDSWVGTRSQRALLVACVVLAGLAAGGCGSDDPAPPSEAAPPPATTTTAEPAAPSCARTASLGGGGTAFAAVARRPTVARQAPAGPAIARFGALNVNGVPSVFAVLGVRRDASCKPAWYHVQLPIRPNGSHGWVPARDVAVRRVTTRIVVDLSDRSVALFHNGEQVIETSAAIGTPENPTPTGRYYVNQRLPAPDPTGPFGPGAVGISAYAPKLVDWAQGGPIAIHGTNTPSKLGLAVSHGCVRIANADLLRVYELAEEGTPVLIRS